MSDVARDLRRTVMVGESIGLVPSAGEDDVEYARRVYDRALDWYKVAEAKAQLILAATGLFLTILGSGLFGKVNDIRALVELFGAETWVFLGISLLAVVGAVLCATWVLLSLHRRAAHDFASLHVDPADPNTYRPEVLWYFGHLASLQPGSAVTALRSVAALRRADPTVEIAILSYNVVHLVRRVLRKHRLINAGWTLTALALVMLIAVAASLIVRAQT
jgi:hypothetical protein